MIPDEISVVCHSAPFNKSKLDHLVRTFAKVKGLPKKDSENVDQFS